MCTKPMVKTMCMSLMGIWQCQCVQGSSRKHLAVTIAVVVARRGAIGQWLIMALKR